MIKKSRQFPTLELNPTHYCTIILVNYEKFFPSIFGYLVLTYLSYFWNFLNIALVSELLMSDHTFHGLIDLPKRKKVGWIFAYCIEFQLECQLFRNFSLETWNIWSILHDIFQRWKKPNYKGSRGSNPETCRSKDDHSETEWPESRPPIRPQSLDKFVEKQTK